VEDITNQQKLYIEEYEEENTMEISGSSTRKNKTREKPPMSRTLSKQKELTLSLS
jgi:hypothetical protein